MSIDVFTYDDLIPYMHIYTRTKSPKIKAICEEVLRHNKTLIANELMLTLDINSALRKEYIARLKAIFEPTN